MNARLNTEAIAFARQLIDEGRFRINTVWPNAEPTPNQARAYLEANGWEAFARWYLMADESARSADAVALPLGDFKSVHRSGLLVARDAAESKGQAEVVEAATELVDWIDHFNAC